MKKFFKKLRFNILLTLMWWFDIFVTTILNIEVTFAGKITTTELVNIVFNFVELFSGRNFYPYQEQFSKRIIRSVLENDGDELTGLFSRQSGKTETVANTVSGMMVILPTLAKLPMFDGDKRLAMFKDGLWVGIFAPSQRQAQITYSRMKRCLECKEATLVLEDPEFNLTFSVSNGQTCALSNGSFATAISASDNANIEGESFKVIICEECQDISDFKMNKSIHPMGAAYNASLIKIGTSTTFKSNFYDTIQRNKALFSEGKISVRNHFEYDCDVAAKYNPRYAKYVEAEKVRLGEQSDAFQMSYKLKWILERGMFIDIVLFEKNNYEPFLNRVMYDKSATHCAGIDLGGKGDDTVITIVEVDWDMPLLMEEQYDAETGEQITYLAFNTYIKDWHVISNQPDYEEQYYEIMDYLSNWKLAKVVCDATREASVSHRLRANMRCEVIPYIFTPKSKSEMYKNLETEINSGRAKVCAGDDTVNTKEFKDFIEQLGELQKDYRGSSLVVHHPDEKGAHDDFPDSWALAVWGCHDRGYVDETETRNRKTFMSKTPNERKALMGVNRFTARRR